MYDVAALRQREFAWADTGESIYLDHASTGPLPRRTIETLQRWNEMRAVPSRIDLRTIFGTLDRARELSSRLIGASPREIALTTNTGHGINLAARSLPLEAGDVVLTHEREFPANVYPWMALSGERGVETRFVPNSGELPDATALLRAMEDRRVRVVAVSWVQFFSGFRSDLEEIGAACRDRGIYFVVDAIQGVGVAELDVRRCHVDVLACGAQKWLLSPWGAGFTYVRGDLVQKLQPPIVSWMAVQASDDFSRLVEYDYTLRDDARRFEMLTLPFQDMAAMVSSLELLHELGVANVASHVATLLDRAVAFVQSDRRLRLVTPPEREHRAGIVAVEPRDARAASRRLREAHVAHSLREGAIRLAPHCYNTPEEVDSALRILADG